MTCRTVFATFCVFLLFCSPGFAKETADSAEMYAYVIVNTYPHDPQAFTQGLVWDNGSFYEGTGLLGRSSLRRVALNSGKFQQKSDLADNIFGEGIAVLGDLLYQLTWENHLAFVYNKYDFSIVKSLEYPRPGWGLTHDNQHLIASDGTAELYFLDPQTLVEKRRITVQDNNKEIYHLNELEYIAGRVYANIYKTDRIATINPADGHVEGWIDLSGLRQQQNLKNDQAVLNGIMYDKENERLFVTGKLWPTLFEIRLITEK